MAKSVLITGASGGIGKTTALYLAQRGHPVIATGRSLARLGELEAEAEAAMLPISIFQLDVNDPRSVSQQVPAILQQVSSLDVLVNNAGYVLWGCLEDLEMEEVEAQFETNLIGVLRMCQAVLPHMRERGHGTIVNVGSIAGQIGTPANGAYAASKAALRALTAVLRMEVVRFGIRVTLIEPGIFRTNLHREQVVGSRALDDNSPYRDYGERTRARSHGFDRRAGDPVKVARTVAKIIASRHPKPRYSVGLDAGLGIMAARLLPDRVLEFFVKRVVSG